MRAICKHWFIIVDTVIIIVLYDVVVRATAVYCFSLCSMSVKVRRG